MLTEQEYFEKRIREIKDSYRQDIKNLEAQVLYFKDRWMKTAIEKDRILDSIGPKIHIECTIESKTSKFEIQPYIKWNIKSAHMYYQYNEVVDYSAAVFMLNELPKVHRRFRRQIMKMMAQQLDKEFARVMGDLRDQLNNRGKI